jgi:nickel-dependent lactate racemase
MKTQFELAYGNAILEIAIAPENLMDILSSDRLPSLNDAAFGIQEAIRNPIGCKPLDQIVKPGESVAMVVPDKTRVSKTELVAPILVQAFKESGISLSDMLVVFATGTHPSHTREEQEAIVGADIASKIRLLDHDCGQKEDLAYAGRTSRGTEVEINRRVLEADRIILLGVITYHYFAGFGGGRKSILPGVAAFDTIQSNHKLVMNPEAGMNEMAVTALLSGNPIHEDMQEAALMADPDFLVNVVLTDHGEIADVFAGDLVQAHARGCKFFDSNYRIGIDELADVVIVSAGGYPKDSNFVQAHKAMDNAAKALKEGGTMILIAEAADGFPSPVYEQWIDLKTLDAIEAGLRENFSIPGHTVYAAMEKAKKFKIIWVTRQDLRLVRKMGIEPVSSAEEAMALVEDRIGKKWQAYLMPDGYMTLPGRAVTDKEAQKQE